MKNVLEREVFFFDLDGTLIDSSDCHARAYINALKSERGDLASIFSYEDVKGLKTSDTFSKLGISDTVQIKRLTELKQGLYRKMIEAGDVKVLPSAYELLERLQLDGKKLCLVTGASRISTDAVLKSHDLAKFFSDTISGDDCTESKPHPQCYLEGLRRYNVDANDAVAVEDSLNGLLSARDANLDVIAVNNHELADYPNYFATLGDVYKNYTGGK